MSYYLIERDAVHVLELHKLRDEFENRIILTDLDQKINAGFHNFVFDMSKIQLMNSIGINFLIMALRKLQESNGQLALANIPVDVLKLLRMTKLDTVFNMQANVEDAIQLINKSIIGQSKKE